MSTHLSPLIVLALSIIALGCYYLLVAKSFDKKFLFSLYRQKSTGFQKIIQPIYPSSHNLIDLLETPEPNEKLELDEPTEEDLSFLELVRDEDSVLLIEAEQIVDKINSVVKNIASRPPNPQEVTSKINNLLKDYRFFENTEYFDAINSFVAVTVERDCDMKYSPDELRALWN